MAYKIQYSPETGKRYPQTRKRQPVDIGRWIGLLLVVAAALWLRINGMPEFLIPGDPDVTKAAAVLFVDQVQSGSSVNDAVTVFCKEILHGAGF